MMAILFPLSLVVGRIDDAFLTDAKLHRRRLMRGRWVHRRLVAGLNLRNDDVEKLILDFLGFGGIAHGRIRFVALGEGGSPEATRAATAECPPADRIILLDAIKCHVRGPTPLVVD